VNKEISKLYFQIQYRQHPDLSVFPSTQFYDSQLLNGVSVEERTMPELATFPWPNQSIPMLFWHVLGVEVPAGTSFKNV
jgi:superfamily I DNA and/or RNA helicase